jgi:hypothetical protein
MGGEYSITLDLCSRTFQNRVIQIFLSSAYLFVLDEQIRWLALGNTEECGRYTVLRQYFEERLHLWGLAPRKA